MFLGTREGFHSSDSFEYPLGALFFFLFYDGIFNSTAGWWRRFPSGTKGNYFIRVIHTDCLLPKFLYGEVEFDDFHGLSFGSRERYQQVRRIGVYPRPYRKTMDKKDVVSNLGSSKDPIINKLLLLHSAP